MFCARPGTKRQRVLAAGAAAALALAAVAAGASAKPYIPPPGAPDLAKMALRASDFAPATKGRQSYVGFAFYYPPSEAPDIESTLTGAGERLAYQSNIDRLTTTGGVKLLGVVTDVALFGTPASAHARFTAILGRYGSESGRRSLVQLAGAGDKLKHAGPLRSIEAGQEAALESLTVNTGSSTIVDDWVWLRVGAVDACVETGTAGPSSADSVAIGLARTVAAHITSVLRAA